MPLKLDHVSHWYGTHAEPVLEDISLLLTAGETVALTGPSGSGKTTLLHIAGALIAPRRGTVSFRGREVVVGELSRPGTLTWVFQSVNVLAQRTVVDNVAAGLLGLGLSHAEARQRATPFLDRVGLGGALDRRAWTLSGGEIQRLCVARALASEPTILIADEPTGQLDETTTEAVADALFEARPERTSLLIATHDMQLAGRCTQQVALVDGKLVDQARQ